MLDDNDDELRRQFRAQVDADVANWIESLGQDEGSGVPPPPRIKITEVSTNPVEFDPFAFGHEGSGTSPAPPTTVPAPWACCLPDGGGCEMMTQADCLAAGGTWKIGQKCTDNPCPFECDGSVSVHHEVSVSVSGTCNSGITFDGSGTATADTSFSSTTTPPFGDAVYCTSVGQPEINETNSTLSWTCESGGGDSGFIFLDTLLARVTTAGDIYGTEFNVGDWVLLVGAIGYDVAGVGSCGGCTDTTPDPNYSVHKVFPDMDNLISISQGGVTTEIHYQFSVS